MNMVESSMIKQHSTNLLSGESVGNDRLIGDPEQLQTKEILKADGVEDPLRSETRRIVAHTAEMLRLRSSSLSSSCRRRCRRSTPR